VSEQDKGDNQFRGAPDFGPGYLKQGPPRRQPIQVFDKKVERASREKRQGFKSESSHKIGKKLRDEFRASSDVY
jgi:hypothetical protein